MATQLYLLRHGETAWSITGQHTGRTDLPLTEKGKRRASQLGERLREVAFDHVLTSPLQRAWQTCELAGYGSVARLEPDLMEWDYGDYEGRKTTEIHTERPGWNVFQDGCPNGESVEDIARRIDRVLAALDALEGVVAVFAHGHLLRSLAGRWIGLPVSAGRSLELDTGSLSILGYEHGNRATPAISCWNTV